MMTPYTHVGSRREVGHVHAGRLYGHKDYSGRLHALCGCSNVYSGGTYKALCGKVVVADHDGEGFNVRPASSVVGEGVGCKACRRILDRK